MTLDHDWIGCPDCGVEEGEPHEDCDVARCLVTGLQRLSCTEEHDCGRQVWSGRWPGEVECDELSWYCYFVPNGQPSWVRCSRDTPGATYDLNRLILEATWNRELERWTLPNHER